MAVMTGPRAVGRVADQGGGDRRLQAVELVVDGLAGDAEDAACLVGGVDRGPDAADDRAHQVDDRGEQQGPGVLAFGGVLEELVQGPGVEGVLQGGPDHDADGAPGRTARRPRRGAWCCWIKPPRLLASAVHSRSRSSAASVPGVGRGNGPAVSPPETPDNSSTAASGPATPASPCDDAPGASAARCSCTRPHCWHAPSDAARARPADTTPPSAQSVLWQTTCCTRCATWPEPAIGPPGEPRGRCRRSHHSRTNASRNSASGSASCNWRCSRSRNVNVSSAWRNPRTLDHSRPRQVGQRRGDLLSAQDRSFNWPSGRNTRNADRARPARFRRLVPSEGRLRLLPGRSRGGGHAPRIPGLPPRRSTRRVAASASSQSASTWFQAGSRPAGPPGSCGTRPGRSPAGPAGPRALLLHQRDPGL